MHRSVVWLRSRLWSLLALAMMLVGVARIVSTYQTFNGTYDEPFNIATGMEWLVRGTYTYQLENPPLARVALAVGPYLAGIRPATMPPIDENGAIPIVEGNSILLAGNRYVRNLALARLGTIPFFLLGCLIVLQWTLRWFDRRAALFALLFFSTLPPILGHAGLATVDMACAATMGAALYGFVRWLESRTTAHAIVFGLAFGAAIATKFLALALMPACLAIGLALVIFSERSGMHHANAWFKQVAIILAVAFVVVWGSYQFHLAPVFTDRGSIDRHVHSPSLRRLAFSLGRIPIPAGQVATGIGEVLTHNSLGHASYLLGEYRTMGWWYYFPLALAVKTPVGFLGFALFGTAIVLRAGLRDGWQRCFTVACAACILLVCMTSHVNIGVRHILAIYVPLAVLAGHAAAVAVSRPKSWVFIVAIVAMSASVAIESLMAHPDYLAYFNFFVSRQPEQVLVESDLDWGQDLLRLRNRLNELGVRDVALRYFGTTPLEVVGLANHREVSATTPTTGYVAISAHYLFLSYACDGSFAWLHTHRPQEIVGKSIFLFDIEDSSNRSSSFSAPSTVSPNLSCLADESSTRRQANSR